MSRYEITDDGKLIRIGCPDGCMETLRPTEPDVGMYLDDIVIAAIRQQQSDLAALKELLAGEVEANEAFRKSGGALDGEDMPTFCARLLSDLASMTKARDELGAHLDQFIAERNQLRARLAAVYSAPTVAFIGIDRKGVARATYFPDPHPSHAMMDLDAKFSKWAIQELITRPAKDGGT